ncbi:hypothetical protein RB195_019742 [Necator americanus]|uniref:Uncharacterized protein n=1 Tax=Necator americanus TaxID=51031 RepID=A0ABR1CFN6_NECAM
MGGREKEKKNEEEKEKENEKERAKKKSRSPRASEPWPRSNVGANDGITFTHGELSIPNTCEVKPHVDVPEREIRALIFAPDLPLQIALLFSECSFGAQEYEVSTLSAMGDGSKLSEIN